LAALDQLIAERRIPPIIAIAPDAPSSQRAGYFVDSQYAGGARMESALTRDLISHVDATYRTIAQRRGRIIAGYSMGGYGALRCGLAHPGLFGAAVVLSPAVYVPLPPQGSSTREFGAFGRGSLRFDNAIYQELNYPALLPGFAVQQLPLAMFIAVGDREMAHADPAEAIHDLDYEAHTLYNRVRRVPGISAQFRVLGGGHDWTVWQPALTEGVEFALRQLGITGN
jgi:enterochelin esterase-like enzyme